MEPKTINTASDQTVTSLPGTPPIVRKLAGKPWYYHMAAVVLATLIGGLVGHYFPAAKPYIPDPLTFAAADKVTRSSSTPARPRSPTARRSRACSPAASCGSGSPCGSRETGPSSGP